MTGRATGPGSRSTKSAAESAEKLFIILASVRLRNAIASKSPMPTPPNAILDTNVVLDWLVFGDPAVGPLGRAIERGDLRWIATASMHEELELVLTRGTLAVRCPQPVDVIMRSRRWSAQAEVCAPSLAGQGLRCSDPDDQPFIDLAAATRSRWLFTRDRALLALARRARGHGVEIRVPAGWSMPAAVR
jgi:predicted nucleic acid-binding protein